MIAKKYDSKCDVWSCGVILYILLCGTPPFNGKNDDIIMEKIKEGTFKIEGEEWEKISDQAKSLVKKMLEYDPENYVRLGVILRSIRGHLLKVFI